MATAQQLTFALEVDDGWPPVAAECLPASISAEGARLLVPPLFVKGLAVGDLFNVTQTADGQVVAWSLLSESGHSTVWIMSFGGLEVDGLLAQARELVCSTSVFPTKLVGAIDLPPAVPATVLDGMLAPYSEDKLAVAYPVWRHE